VRGVLVTLDPSVIRPLDGGAIFENRPDFPGRQADRGSQLVHAHRRAVGEQPGQVREDVGAAGLHAELRADKRAVAARILGDGGHAYRAPFPG
jgi:hypothetical protein